MKIKIVDGFVIGPISIWEWIGCKLGFHIYYPEIKYCLSCGKSKKQ